MPFAIQERQKTNYKNAVRYDKGLGKHYFRILRPTEQAVMVNQHFFLGKGSIVCLGREECPVCQNNARLIMENPGKKYKDIQGLNWESTSYLFNVMDLTEVKVCPNEECKTEVVADPISSRFADACPNCNTMLVGVQPAPSNKVKVLSLYESQAGIINQYEATQSPITAYDIRMKITKTANDKKNTDFEAEFSRNTPIKVADEDLYDPMSTVFLLTASEINDWLRGTRFKDIFAARKSQVEEQVPWEEKASSESLAAAQANVNSLFED